MPELNAQQSQNNAVPEATSVMPAAAAGPARQDETRNELATRAPDTSQPSVDVDSSLEPAIKIIAQRKQRNGPFKFLVLFQDKSRHWADEVSDELLKQFRIQQEQRRQRKRKADVFNNLINY